MKLSDKIVEISTRWINPMFAEQISVPRQLDSLAVKAFQKMFLHWWNSTDMSQTDAEDCSAIFFGLRMLELGSLDHEWKYGVTDVIE